MKRRNIKFTGWYPANGGIVLRGAFCDDQDAQGEIVLVDSDGHVDYWQLVGDRKIVFKVAGESDRLEAIVDYQ